MKLGFIGLGEMGIPMAEKLARKKYPLAVYDIASGPMKRLEALGAMAASGPAMVAEHSDFVIIIVRNTDQVQNVLFGDNGIVSATSLPDSVAIMSTISPVDAIKMAAQLKAKGVEFMDAPVSGARQRAESGELTIMVGGDVTVFQKHLPVLEVFGSHVFHVGDVGAGQYAKLINNMLLLVNMCAAHEAKALAEGAGMDPEAIFDVVRVSTGKSWVVDNWETVDGWKRDYFPGGTLDLLYKDIDITLSLGEKKKVPLILSSLAKQLVRY